MDREKLWHQFRNSFNFYRIHLTVFTLTPLVFSAIFYASNGEFHISFIDSLFNCVSAMTVTGLTTVDLSSLTGWQQTILFLLQSFGNIVIVSWFMVYVRRRYFKRRFNHIVEAALKRKTLGEERTPTGISRIFSRRNEKRNDIKREERKRNKSARIFPGAALERLRPDMIRRVDDAPQLINPSGWVSENPLSTNKANGHHNPPATAGSSEESGPTTAAESSSTPEHPEKRPSFSAVKHNIRSSLDQDGFPPRRESSPPTSRSHGIPLTGTLSMRRIETVEFAAPPSVPDRTSRASGVPMTHRTSSRQMSQASSQRLGRYPTIIDERFSGPGYPFPAHRTATMHTHRTHRPAMDKGFGGFPGPQAILMRLFRKFFPKLQQRFVRSVTIPQTTTMRSVNTGAGTTTANTDRQGVSYITFDAIVGRNSKFHGLTEEDLEELGGVEYRALTALLWIVGGYHIGIQMISFIVIAPYISTKRWRSDFEPPQLHRYVPPAWFAAFQVVSAYTNAGMSLVDQSMVPFQEAYVMIVFLIIPILAGNTAFPVFLRFTIWTIKKLVPLRSRTNETLHFLLDHPRRCFIYLFPSHQTWFLLTIVLSLTVTDWFFFLVLDLGNPALDMIPVGVRVILGVLQATAVRAAGFVTVSLSALAPAVQVLYVMMMYVSVYPIALSVRSTNVYEERSLGVFEDDDDGEPDTKGSRVHVWGRYIGWHARKQLAFDMWWICLALFLVCIIEKDQLENESNFSWFTIFSIIFELVSAYGTVGLSLGLPYANYSFSGALSPLSKLIICAVMIRGRHRGLPVAIDRAVLLPFEYEKKNEEELISNDEDQDENEAENDYTQNQSSANFNNDKQLAYPAIRTESPQPDANAADLDT